MPRVDVLPQVLRDAGADQRLQGVQPIGAQPVQRPVEGREVNPVHRIRDRGGEQLGHLRRGPPQLGEARRELGPGQPHPVRVAAEQLVVPAPGDLLGHQRPDLVAQPHRLAAGDQGVDRVGTEETGQRRPAGAQLVVRLGVVGRPPRRAHDQPRLGPRRQVPQLVAVRLEAPAPALEQQHQEVDEGQSHAADQHRLPRREDRQVGVGGLLWRQVAQPVVGGPLGQRALVRGRRRVQVSGGEHHRVHPQRRAVAQLHQLRVAVLGEPGGHGAVQLHPDTGGQRGDHVPQHPGQVGALQSPAGEGRRGDRA